jgi:hypothetical protein
MTVLRRLDAARIAGAAGGTRGREVPFNRESGREEAMPRTVAALFESRASAAGALQALVEAGVAGHQSALLACKDAGAFDIAPHRALSPDDGDFRQALRELGLPAADTAEFEEAVRRGGCLLSARVDGAAIGRAVEILEAFEPVDLDRRAAQGHGGDRPGARSGDRLGAGLAAGAAPGQSNAGALPGMAGMARSTHDVGASDLNTRELGRADRGSSTMATGGLRAEERAGAPGVTALAYRRDTDRSGRVRTYIRG